MDRVFGGQKGQNLEVYVDDILVKSKKKKDHLKNLEETIHNLRNAGIKSKSNECTFVVMEGQFLGCMIPLQGIKRNLEKNQVVLKLKPPKTVKKHRN